MIGRIWHDDLRMLMAAAAAAVNDEVTTAQWR